MREIKFRAWDKVDKKMLHWGSGIIHIDHGLNVQSVPRANWCPAHIITLMQYTGLKDKNGKEIFEGDIARSYTGKQWEQVHEIRWYQDRCAFWMYIKNEPHLDLAVYREYLEIIGNIYENPELLK